MDDDTCVVVTLRIERAHEELDAARALIRDPFYRIATSRADLAQTDTDFDLAGRIAYHVSIRNTPIT